MHMVYQEEAIKTDILYSHLLMRTGCSLADLTYTSVAILIQKHHPYTGNLNSETSVDSKNALLMVCLVNVSLEEL